LITLKGNDEIASVAKIEHDDEEEVETDTDTENAGDETSTDEVTE